MSELIPSHRIPSNLKSELCSGCGKCCMSAGFWLGPVTGPETWDHIRWIRLHGLKVDLAEVDGTMYYGVEFPRACSELRIIDGRYICGIYETRPELCRTYDCTDPQLPLFRVKDPAWMVWLDEHPPPPSESSG